MNNIKYLDKTEREIDRYKLYVSVQSNSKKKLKPEDIMKLPWDDDDVKWSEEYKEDVAKQRKETEERMKQIIKNMNM